MRLVLLASALIFAAGCGQETKDVANATPKPRAGIDQALLGEWVTAATSANHYDGVLHLAANGTFREEDKFRKDGTVQKVEGSFTLKTGSAGEVVMMAVEKLDGKSVPGGPPIELNFDRKAQNLSNFLPGVVYTRRGGTARAKVTDHRK